MIIKKVNQTKIEPNSTLHVVNEILLEATKTFPVSIFFQYPPPEILNITFKTRPFGFRIGLDVNKNLVVIHAGSKSAGLGVCLGLIIKKIGDTEIKYGTKIRNITKILVAEPLPCTVRFEKFLEAQRDDILQKRRNSLQPSNAPFSTNV
eukprot:UN23466